MNKNYTNTGTYLAQTATNSKMCTQINNKNMITGKVRQIIYFATIINNYTEIKMKNTDIPIIN